MYVLGTAVCDVTINRLSEPGSSQGTIEETYVKSLFFRVFSVLLPYHFPLVTTVFTKIMSSFSYLRFQYFYLSSSFPSSLHRSTAYTTQHALFVYRMYVIYEDSTYFAPLFIVTDLSILKFYYSCKYSIFKNVIANKKI